MKRNQRSAPHSTNARQILRDELGFDLRERLFADDADALRATGLTQPAIFATEYALARLWMSYGVAPVAMIGHSVGEFVAAVIAGVMSVADGARLVARRGRLMQALPSGSMLSVRLDAAQLHGPPSGHVIARCRKRAERVRRVGRDAAYPGISGRA